jgi:hypothetical protein
VLPQQRGWQRLLCHVAGGNIDSRLFNHIVPGRTTERYTDVSGDGKQAAVETRTHIRKYCRGVCPGAPAVRAACRFHVRHT